MSTILTSLHGKQAGIDKDGFLTSPVGVKAPAIYVGASDAEVRVGDVSVTQATISSTGTSVGDTLPTANGKSGIISIQRINGLSTYSLRSLSTST